MGGTGFFTQKQNMYKEKSGTYIISCHGTYMAPL